MADPAHPRPAGSLPGRPLSTARELRAVPAAHLLVVMTYALGRGGGNRFDLYRWATDCTHPEPTGALDFGARAPHEFFLWTSAARTLLFTAMFSGAPGDLQVIDISDPASPHLVGAWSPPVGLLHSVTVTDGGTAYLSLWTGGLLVADASDFIEGRPAPMLRLLTPAAAALPALRAGNVHSAVPVPGRPLVLVTDERYPPACPYGPARLVDVSDPAHLRVVATLAAPENDPASCAAAPVGTYTSHNPTLTPNLAFISWYSSGLQVFDIADAGHPAPVAEYRPAGGSPAGARDPQLGVTQALTWSYPVLRDGLVYVADINQGLYLLRYQGPHAEEVAAGFREGNSNLSAPAAPPAPTSAPAPAVAGPVVVATASAARARPGDDGRRRLVAVILIVLAAAGVLILAADRLRRHRYNSLS